MKQPRLRIIGGDQHDEEIILQVPTTIGRGKDNDLSLSHPLVSRHHCRLIDHEGNLYVEDLNSLNGTYVGNQRVEDRAPLGPGELLTIGTMTFRAIYGPSFDSDEAVEATSERLGSSVLDEETVDIGAGATRFVPGQDADGERNQPTRHSGSQARDELSNNGAESDPRPTVRRSASGGRSQ